jgi:SNF2 family DNA or RNA helicase
MTIQVVIDGPHILALNVPFKSKDAIKRIYGCKAKYDKSVKPEKFIGWHLPLTMDTCYALRRTFGRDLAVHDDLTRWARLELQRQSSMEEIRTGTAAELTRVAELTPKMHQAMLARPYQPVGASFIVHGLTVLLGDDPGLGKTMQTLAALVESGAKRILVVAPLTTVSSVWSRETNEWAPVIMPFVASGALNRAQREQAIEAFETTPYDAKMLIINPAMVRAKKHWKCPDGTEWDVEPGTVYRRRPHPKACHNRHGYETIDKAHNKFVKYQWPQLYAKPWDAIVMDESHELLASTANIQSKRITQSRLGAVHLRRRLRQGGLALALSGTPFRSDLHKAWGTLNWLAPSVFTSFHKWAQSNFDYEEDTSNGWGQPDYKQEPRDIVKFNNEIRPYFLARSKADAAPDLPPVQYMGTRPLDNQEDGLKAIWLELTSEQEKAYARMEELGEAQLRGGKLLANGVLAEITRKRQLASAHGYIDVNRQYHPGLPSNKIEWVLEFLREQAGHDTKVVIASEFTQMCDLTVATIALELKMEALAITGKVTGKDRDIARDRFQDPNDPCKVMILNMSAGGVGITLDAADYMILMDVPWVSDKEKQVVDRIHRVSRVHNVFVYRLLSLGTVDEWMGSLTDDQRRILQSASPAAIELAREGLAT